MQRRRGRMGEHKYFPVGVVASSECRLSLSRVRTLEYPLDLAARQLLLALARAVRVAVNYMAQPW